jgi:hypothetical protein
MIRVVKNIRLHDGFSLRNAGLTLRTRHTSAPCGLAAGRFVFYCRFRVIKTGKTQKTPFNVHLIFSILAIGSQTVQKKRTAHANDTDKRKNIYFR